MRAGEVESSTVSSHVAADEPMAQVNCADWLISFVIYI